MTNKDICKALRTPQYPGQRIAKLYIEAANEIERLKKQVHELIRQIEHYHGKWRKPEKEVYDKIKGHAVTHSDAEPS